MPGEPAGSIPQIGDIIDGKYAVDQILGQGGMGVVVAAHPVDGHEQIALKLLIPEALVVSNAVERFFREANTLARLTSEHVVRIHTVGHQPGSGLPYMVMELLRGQNLDEIVKAQGPLPIQDACACILQACKALAEAHSLGIIHRDIKPANLFRIEQGGEYCTKVIDFGIAKELDSSGPRTQTQMVMGSVTHMSPEQLRAAKYAEPRSDIWAIGATLFELLTGKRAFVAQSLPQLIVSINCDPPRPIRALRPEIPEGLEAILLRCLEKKPEKRFQSMEELIAALLPFATGTAPAPLPPRPEAPAPAPAPAPRAEPPAEAPPDSLSPTPMRATPASVKLALVALLLGLIAVGFLFLRGGLP